MAQIVIQGEAKNLGCIRWMLSGFFLLSVARMTIKGEESRINQEKMPFLKKKLLEKFAGLEKSRTFASLLKQETSGV